jgi:hypothetical protein
MPLFILGLVLGGAIGYMVAWRRKLIDLMQRSRSRDKQLANMSRDELYQQAQEADIPGRSHMNKDELREALADDGRVTAGQLIDALSGTESSESTRTASKN